MPQNSEELLKKIKLLESELKKVKSAKRYGLVWEDKPEIFDKKSKNALPILQEDKALRIEDSDDKPQNIIIEGDNYHSLSTLSYTHKGKIDVIYIDPPYNTGIKKNGRTDFIYNDTFIDKEDTYRHSKWLSFMSKRLNLAKDLLTDDGIIFISIDDNEQAQLKILCDEIFRENNFVGKWNWFKSATPPNLSKKIKKNIEYIYCYERKKNNFQYTGIKKNSTSTDPLTKPQNSFKTLVFPPYSISINVKQKLIKAGSHGTKKFPNKLLNDLIIKNGTNENEVSFENKFVWIQDKLNEELENDTKIFASKDIVLSYKKSDYADEVPPNLIDESFGVGTTEQAGKDLEEIFGNKIFDYPKPISLMNYLLGFRSNKKAVILDFFAGSGTTGHAVMELNKEDGGNRQFILCSSRENSKEEPDKNICKDITYERNKRVIEGYKNSKGENIEGLGGNLRYYTTEFIKADKSIDDLRYSFIDMCDDLLCIKENTFSEVTLKDGKPELKLFKSGNKYTAILYDIHYFTDLLKLLQVLDGKIAVYIFSLSKDIFEEEVEHLEKDIVIQNIPDDILETYNKIFNF